MLSVGFSPGVRLTVIVLEPCSRGPRFEVVANTVPVPSSEPELNVVVACPDELLIANVGFTNDPLGGLIPPIKLHVIVNPEADIFSYAAFLNCAVNTLEENVFIELVPEIDIE